MADESKEAFAELLEQVKALRAAGVAKASFDGGALLSVEFFEQKAPTFGALGLDTLVPAADPLAETVDADAGNDAGNERIPEAKVPAALARLLKQGSVS